MDIATFFSTLFTGKLAWVKVLLGVIATIFVSFGDLIPILPAGAGGKAPAWIGIIVGIGTWLTMHGFHGAAAPAANG